ncbi:MAG: DUF5990 family protein [Bacteroidota bacterium]|nr:DUF5990 family protein [Bacteroidota bacterium]
MDREVTLRIVLESPTPGVDYGLQEGKGIDFKTIQTKRGNGENLEFECSVRVKIADNNIPVFLGSYAQGPANERFIYIDIGKFAGQKDSCWDRRLKIPLRDITMEIIQQVLSNPKQQIETVVAGSGKDGSPNCGTVKPFNGWKIKKGI